MIISGPFDAKVMLVGEAPGENEILKNLPFVGLSGMELDKMLSESGFQRSNCFATNVCHERPPGNDIELWFSKNKNRPKEGEWEFFRGKWVNPKISRGVLQLEETIQRQKPELVLGFGNLALWALTDKWGITDWRGSQMEIEVGGHSCKFVPVLHPALILRDWGQRFITVHDLKRAYRYWSTNQQPPEYRFAVRPEFEGVIEGLRLLIRKADEEILYLAVDIETRNRTACIGLAWSRFDAVCIPFMCIERREGYWTEKEEAAILYWLLRLLMHKNARCIGQNFLYDVQHLLRDFCMEPTFHADTMLGHHVCFPGFPKGLDFLSSLYCDYHRFWKAESKDWHKSMQEDELWMYNCKDCVITFEVWEHLQSTVDALNLRVQYDEQMQIWRCALKAMRKGLFINSSRRAEVRAEVVSEIEKINKEIEFIVGHPLNIKSPLQMKQLFYEDLKIPPIKSRKTGAVSTDDESLEKIKKKMPALSPLVNRIQALRSLGVFLGTFVEMEPSEMDGRMRCFFNPAGTDTFRFSSSTDAFGSGGNLQNLPKGDEE